MGVARYPGLVAGSRRRSARIGLIGLVLALAAQLLLATGARAIGAPVVIDDFAGTTLGTRTVTLLPLAGTSTTPQGTFTQNGNGTATMTMNGQGNGVGGVQLDYTPEAPTDLTSGGNNTQLFVDLEEVQRLPVQMVGETALNLSVQVTSGGVTGTLNTGLSNVFAFSPALPFSGFSPTINWTTVTKVSVQFRYPQNYDYTASLTVIAGTMRATPSGGSPPAAPTPAVTTSSAAVTGGPGTVLTFTVAFTATGQPAAVTYSPPSDTGLRAQDVQLTTTAPGTVSASVSGGPSTYTVSVSGMTGSGTVSIHIPASVVQDTWGQFNVASSGDPTIAYTFGIPPVITSASSHTYTVGSSGSFTVTATGTPPPALTESGALPSGVTFTDNGNATATIAGTPATGAGGVYSLGLTASNGISPNATQTFSLAVDEAPSITSPSSGTLVVGTAGGVTVTTGHAYPTPTLSESGALPSGVAFTDNGNGTGSIHGTPAAGTGGTYSLTLGASNGVGSAAAKAFVLTVAQQSPFTSASSSTFTVGAAGSFTVTTAPGYPTPPVITESGALPGGVTFTDNGDGTATLSGTPAAGTGGVYSVTLTSSNGVAPDATQSFTLTVDQAPAITSGASTSFSVGQLGVFIVTTTGYPAPNVLVTGGLPAGLTFTDNGNGTGTLVGNPATGTGGVYIVNFAAINGVSPAAGQTFTLTVDEAPVITSASSTTFLAGTPGSFTVTTAHSYPTSPLLSESGALPSGVTFVDNGDGTATLAGTPTGGSGGVYTLSLSAVNGVAPDGSQTFTLTVFEAPSITSATTATFGVGIPGSFTVTTGPCYPGPPVIMESGPLPTGLTFVDNGDGTATFVGTPAAGSGGSYFLTLTAANGVLPDAVQSFMLTVGESPVITSAASTTFVAGSASSFTVTTAHAYPMPALTESGSLPGGVTFTDNGDGTGTLAGTPAGGSGGVYTLTLTASNGAGPDSTQAFTLTVDEAPWITSAGATTFTVDNAGTFSVTATGFPTPGLSLTGTLPTGVTFDPTTGTLSGTPAAGTAGSWPLTFTASDGVSPDASQPFTLTVVRDPVTLALTASPTTITQGQSETVTVTVTGPASLAVKPVGTVTIWDGTVQLGTATVDPGTATFTTSSLAAGTHQLSATYSGDEVYAPVTAETAAVAVDVAALVPVPTTGAGWVTPLLPVGLVLVLVGVAALRGRRRGIA